MFYLIDKITGKIEDGSTHSVSAEGYDTIERDFTDIELDKIEHGCHYINDVIVETEEYGLYVKSQKIQEYKKLEDIAVELRSKYLTAEMLPEGELKTRKLAKLVTLGEEAQVEFDAYFTKLLNEYGDIILDELI